jgi:glycosyltransferase involved in cell wall biosynthesis
MTVSPNIYIDISSLLSWTGTATGMIRVESELYNYVKLHLPDATSCFYDISTNTYRGISDTWIGPLTGPQAMLAPPLTPRDGWVRFTPNRSRALLAMERIRLKAENPLVADVVDRLQRMLLKIRKHHFPIDDCKGGRISLVPRDMAIGESLRLGENDLVISASSDWSRKDPVALAELKQQQKFLLVVICYDVIPFLFPQFFPAQDVESFRVYWEQMFDSADLVFVNAKCTKNDIENYCRNRDLALTKVAVAPLGCDLTKVLGKNEFPLRPELRAQQYVLFVSTIEPRKNHRLLLSVWRDLMADGLIDRTGFKLVFVGRRGWMNEEVQSQLDRNLFSGSVLYLEHVDDEELSSLYANAAFCVYPSLYEGFGLPVVEAFARGKAVICSTGGSLGELFEGVMPCFPPHDESAWRRLIASWIEYPNLPKEAASRIANGFQAKTWPEAISNIIALTLSSVQFPSAAKIENSSVNRDKS